MMRALLLLVFLEIATGLAPGSLCFAGGGGAVTTLQHPAAGSRCVGRSREMFPTRRWCEDRGEAIPATQTSSANAGRDSRLRRRRCTRGAAILVTATKASSEASKVEFSLRRARPHELDLLAILSTEAFTPRGAWFDVVQRVKFLLVRWDLQAQFYQRFYHWKDVVKDFDPPLSESRYALLAAAKPNGNAIGVTELCVAPNPASREYSERMNLKTAAPYLSNLAVDVEFRRNGIGQGLVKWCEELSAEWGHNVLFLHVDVSNEAAIKFYRSMGFVEAPRDMAWYDRIGRQDLQVEKQLLLVKIFEGASPQEPEEPGVGQEAQAQHVADEAKDEPGPLS